MGTHQLRFTKVGLENNRKHKKLLSDRASSKAGKVVRADSMVSVHMDGGTRDRMTKARVRYSEIADIQKPLSESVFVKIAIERFCASIESQGGGA